MPAIDAEPLGDELVLGLRIMHQDQIGIARAAVAGAWPLPTTWRAHQSGLRV
jgi:hypothetical protein